MAHAGTYSLYSRYYGKSKQVYWYYRVTLPDGYRTIGKATGQTSKTLARRYCDNLYKSGILIPKYGILFDTFARGWFVWDMCPYVKDRLEAGTVKRPGITQSYARQLRGYLSMHILPYFRDIPLEKITPVKIRKWRLWLKETRVQNGTTIRGLGNKTINNVASCLRIMLDWARNDDLIEKDPFRGISQFLVDDDSRDAFTLSQVSDIFSEKWDSYDAWLFTFTAAVTGMREAAVRALNRESIHEKYIDVKQQYKAAEGLSPLKTKDARKVPICKMLYDLLDKQTSNRIFTFDMGDGVPIGVKFATKRLDKIVMEKFPEENGLVFHSLRHFYNTYLQAENVSVNKVDAVIGHSGGKGSMTARYTDWRPEMFPEVYEAHEKLVKMLLQ